MRARVRIFLFLFFLQLPGLVQAQAESSDLQTNYYFHPLPMFRGSYYLGADIKVADSSWTLGPLVVYGRRNFESGADGYIEVFGGGAQAVFYMRRPALTQGWYLSSSALFAYARAEEELIDGTSTGEANGLIFDALIGYHWAWNHFNIKLGAGYTFGVIGEATVTSADGSQTRKRGYNWFEGPTIDFILGLAFGVFRLLGFSSFGSFVSFEMWDLGARGTWVRAGLGCARDLGGRGTWVGFSRG